MKNATASGFVVAIVGIVSLGAFLSLTVIVLGIDAVIVSADTEGSSVLSALLAENGQTVMVATVGAIATIAGGALGYQMGLDSPTPAEEELEQLALRVEENEVESHALIAAPPLTNPFVDDTTHDESDLEEWDRDEEVTDDTEDSPPQRP
jgi:hypothetical protein